MDDSSVATDLETIKASNVTATKKRRNDTACTTLETRLKAAQVKSVMRNNENGDAAAALTTTIQSFLVEHELLPAWQSHGYDQVGHGYEQVGLIMIETYLSNQDAHQIQQNIMQALRMALGEERARALIQLVADFRRDDTARADDGSINHRVDAHDDDGGGSSISS
mmetsp:Transcript_67497/g.75611  ORF Transcript_67497/g.75611 Transcript_67497/m.75611 type:complete len:166 (+) Transcript_67497:184-681(+)